MLPNIVFIVADDLGYADLSCCGRRDFSTPNIDRIAERGLRFTQAYANSAVCSATRLALITGRYQYRLPLGLEEPLAGKPMSACRLRTRLCRRCCAGSAMVRPRWANGISACRPCSARGKAVTTGSGEF